MRNPVDLTHPFADTTNGHDHDRFAARWNLLKVFQHVGAIPMQRGATR